jgi:hypothetical protein
MELSKDFVFKAHRESVKLAKLLPPSDASRLGPLAPLLGTWKGQGFNQIWRPFHATPPVPASQDRFLELNLTDETLQFEDIPGAVPNRGLLQEDIDLFGMTYLQQVQDHNTGEGIHVETGIWLHVPATTQPQDASTVVRMGSIPHGTTIEAQGIADSTTGAPTIDPVDITPFLIGQPKERIPFPESNLAVPSEFRTPPSQLTGITQEMVDNPNVVLSTALQGQTVVRTITLRVSSRVGVVAAPSSGGGVANIAFLTGNPKPNARSAQVDAVFWIEVVTDASGETFEQLQYTQTVLLDFNGLSWPHVSVATLRRVKA